MGRKRIGFFLAVFFLLAMIGFAGCGGGSESGGEGGNVPDPKPKIEPIKLSSIAITAVPDKIIYAVGEELDIAGLVVTGTYSDGSKKTEAAKISNVSGFDSSVAGDQILTVTVGGKTATFKITVVAVTDHVLYERWYYIDENWANEGIFSAEIANGVLSQEEELYPEREDWEWIYSPAYSPDKTKVACAILDADTDQKRIAVLDLETGIMTTIFDDGGFHDDPRWNSTGTQLTFTYKEVSLYSLGDICIINADGSGFQNLTNSPDFDDGYSVFNPIDDTEIAYNSGKGSYWNGSNDEYESDIFKMNITTGTTINLTNTPDWEEEDPYFFPDGSKITFDTTRDSYYESPENLYGFWDIWTMNADGSDPQTLYEYHNIGWPIVSADGLRVYASPNKPNPSIVQISVADGSAIEIKDSTGVVMGGAIVTDVR